MATTWRLSNVIHVAASQLPFKSFFKFFLTKKTENYCHETDSHVAAIQMPPHGKNKKIAFCCHKRGDGNHRAAT
jgi:hypothetical protein